MAFFYRDGQLHLGTNDQSRSVQSLLPKPWTKPAYIYDLDDISRRYHALDKALSPINHTIHYALKANSNIKILRYLTELGAGVDTVSGGEVTRALEAGLDPSKIIFSGVAKTVSEIELALERGIKQINVESPQELERIAKVAGHMGRTVDVAFRLNPDVNPQTHPYITTGFRENKFGMDESFLPDLVKILRQHPKQLRPRGLTMHIGSLLFDLAVFREAIEKTIAVHKRLSAEGFALDRLDIGGGLGIRYETNDDRDEFALIEAYGKMVCETIAPLFDEGMKRGKPMELLVEPGRILVARSGLLVSEVQYVKTSAAKTFAIVDTGMHHLLRPALYQAKHRVLALKNPSGAREHEYDVVGPICESSDCLAKQTRLPELSQGDLLGIADSGAYGFSMASRYNSHELPHEICIKSGEKI